MKLEIIGFNIESCIAAQEAGAKRLNCAITLQKAVPLLLTDLLKLQEKNFPLNYM